ncbi:MAG TPA: ATP-binding cassette domain-containing protein, partial [Acidimicrobiia bacterium]|nr:ATP-binding cassette domain-containing protein [Acidimicrobiia bacterium]
MTVEVGGRVTTLDATFTLQAGDKVGLVGRNGAGKTSLLRVLGGLEAPIAGTIQRPAAFGYLPQDPRTRGEGVDATGLSHVLSGRGLDAAALRLEKLRLRLDED